MGSPINQSESQDIYEKLNNSISLHFKSLNLESESIFECLLNTLAVQLTGNCHILTGSTGEGTDITLEDYDQSVHSKTPRYISDLDFMSVMCDVRVIDEGYTLPHIFDNHTYLRAERGRHTTDGFRKLRIIHSPQYYSIRQYKSMQWLHSINMSLENGFVSSSKLLATRVCATTHSPVKWSIKLDLGTQGPSHIVERDGYTRDTVFCFYVKTWPKEAESWFTRQSHWPDWKLKSKIRIIGHVLVPTGSRNSHESDLEWRCSFSIAEKILFQSLTKFQRYTFIMFKALLKEYLPSDVNTDSEKQLLSTYHIKTLFLWCLEDSRVKWESGYMLTNISYMLDKLLMWIKEQYFQHFFIPSVNLLDGRRLQGRQISLICFISAIRNDLANKIKQSQFFMAQEKKYGFAFAEILDDKVLFMLMHNYVMLVITGQLHMLINTEVFHINMIFRKLNFSHSKLIESIISIKADVYPKMQHLYRAIYTDPVHAKLLTEVVPGLVNQYRGCMYLAMYCMTTRDDHVLPGVLDKAESLLKDTLHLDPCSGHVKLACLYIATGDFLQALSILHAAENNFLFIYDNMVCSAPRYFQLNKAEQVNRLRTEVSTAFIHDVFQKWAEGQITSDIVVTWPEYITVPALLQFELIHESTQQVIDKYGNDPGKMVTLDCFLQWPPLSFIKLLKFVCAFYSDLSSTSHMENLAADLITSALSVTVFPGVTNDIYTVFNMAAWCYVKIRKYQSVACMMTLAIGSSSETIITDRCAFSHHFLAYIIEHCLAKGNTNPG